MTPIQDALGIDLAVLGSLPPDVRDALLDYVLQWAPPAEALALVDLLREAHGPLLFLLQIQATALLAQGETAAALEVIERRQRRSSTIASQILEARALLLAGRSDLAASMAAELAEGAKRSQAAQVGAARLLCATGNPAHAELALTFLSAWLTGHPGDLPATLALVEAALVAGDRARAAEAADRFGAGVPADMPDDLLGALAAALEALGRRESAEATRNESERRRRLALARLRTAVAPYTSLAQAEQVDSGELFRRLHGPESVIVSPEERRRIRLETMRHFGFAGLRHGQTEAIACVLRGESLLVIMPTGAGKSLIYQLPGLLLPRPSLVISPLIALMKDQVESLPPLARRSATFINSTLTDEETAERMAGIAQGRYKLIYAAPERLRQRAFLRALRQGGIDLLVIDEAHCVSLWGHDFRPDYLFLQEARRELGSPPTLAMTATAPPRVRDEILDYMRVDGVEESPSSAGSPRPPLILDTFRSNLHLSALRLDNEEQKLAAVTHFVAETSGAGIIYVNSRHKSETLAWALRQVGVSAEPYHAGLDRRNEVQDRFMAGQTRVVVATVAFGMGIDKADIRFIVHFHPSRSLESYYQEVGRAGRDGLPSQGLLLYSNNDWANLRRWAQSDEYSRHALERLYRALVAQLATPEAAPNLAPSSELGAGADGSAAGEPLAGLVRDHLSGAVDGFRLQQVAGSDETAVRVGISLLERADLLTRGFDVSLEGQAQLPPALPPGAREHQRFRDFARAVALRPGTLQLFKLAQVAATMDISHADLEALLLEWHAARWLQVKLSKRALYIELPPTPPDAGARLDRLLNQAQALGRRRIDDMVGFATTEGCRHGTISAHFGSEARTTCAVCDNCTGVRPNLPTFEPTSQLLPDEAEFAPLIVDCLISLPRPMGRSGLARILVGHLRAGFTPDKARHHGALKALGETGVLPYIDDLLARGLLRQYERQGFLVLAPTLAGRTEAEAWREQHPELQAYGAAPAPSDEETDEAAPAPEAADSYTGLQKALWLWRRRLAEELQQPPYIVMSNQLMLQIAERRPLALEELATLSGMGPQRLAHYGPTVIDLVRLNPPNEGDAELLQAQRATLTEAMASGESKAAAARSLATPARMQKQIYVKLQEIRQQVAVSRRERPGGVAGNALLTEIAALAPATLEALEAVTGFRGSSLRNEGPQIVAFIAALRRKAEETAPGSANAKDA